MVSVCRIVRVWTGSDAPFFLARNECDTTGRGCLDREAFVKGMWRIDEELRRAQAARQAAPSGPYRVRQPKRVPVGTMSR
jgi:hypothetical protein